jgi:hypothetical protein
MPIKSFRGLIADNTQDTISLHTNDGSTGYRITKFQIFANTPGATANVEHVVKIYKIDQQGTIDGVVDFSDNTLLAAGFLPGKTSEFTQDDIVVFDNEIFNQDIYVTHSDVGGSTPVNYYIELEQIKLDLNESTVATLKDIRNIKSQ